MPHPTLLPGIRRFWRDLHTLQLGLDPATAITVHLADPRTGRLLELLDGTRSERALRAEASRRGIDDRAAAALLGALRETGLLITAEELLPRGLGPGLRARLLPEAAALGLRRRLQRRLGVTQRTPAAVLRRRLSAKVVITGFGRLVTPIAAALAHAGVGHVEPALTGLVDRADLGFGGLAPADLQQRRSLAAAAEVRRSSPDTDTGPIRDRAASLIVQVGTSRPPNLEALSFRAVPHLAVAVRDGRIVVGPLVRPGVAPCLNCLDLHRQDRDPAWPAINAQLRTGRADTEACETTVALVGVGVVAAEVLDFLDGRRPRSAGATIEVVGPGGQRRRSWPPHPDCGCAAPQYPVEDQRDRSPRSA